MFLVVGVTGVDRMEGRVPLSKILVIRHGDRLRNFGRDEELLLFKILSAFVQLWRHRSRYPVFGWRWYPMQQPKTVSLNCQTSRKDKRGKGYPKTHPNNPSPPQWRLGTSTTSRMVLGKGILVYTSRRIPQTYSKSYEYTYTRRGFSTCCKPH